MENQDLTRVVRIKVRGKKTSNALNRPKIERSTRKGSQILENCRAYWDALRPIRDVRRENRHFRNGNQWTKTELDDIKSVGGMPITQNICALLVRNMVGQYWTNKTTPVAVARKQKASEESGMLSSAIERVIKINNDDTKDARNLEELIQSGIACCRISYSWNAELNMNEIYTVNTNTNRLIFNPDIEDTALTNLHTIGEICDATIDDMIVNFAKTKEDELYLRQIYEGKGSDNVIASDQSADKLDNMDFYNPYDVNTCRYFEVWQKEMKHVVKYHDYAFAQMGISEYTMDELEVINQKRLISAHQQGIPSEEVALIEYEEGYESVWTVKYIAWNGAILKETVTPYLHGQHPYVLLLHTFIDGEIHPMLSDIIPQQRYMNRLIQMIDFAMGRAAKGVLIVPEDCIPEDGNINDMAKRWSDFNGVIKTKATTNGSKPEQIVANLVNFGAREMFETQMQLAQKIFGVNEAMQGQAPASGTPASRYLQETQNSSLNSKDLFEMYAKYKGQKYYKMMTLIKQFYTDKIYMAVSGRGTTDNENVYDPDRVKNLDFDITVSSANNSPSYALMQEEQLHRYLEAGLIDLEMALSLSSSSFAPQLLEAVKKRKDEQQEQQAEMAMQQQGMQQQQGQPTQEAQQEPVSEEEYINNVG